jgi:DNA-binding response OmpR family regulator
VARVCGVEHEETLEPTADEHDAWSHHEAPEPEPEPTLRVLVYSDDRTTRQQVRAALGRRPAADLPVLEYVEVATPPMVISQVDRGGFDLLILDGEATPAGGMGICRQLKDEIYRCSPILVLVGRPQDAWLATWSRADAVVAHPIDAIALARTATKVLRPRVPATSSS